MEEMVNRAVISIEDPFMDLELINCLLRVALEYNLCEVDVTVDGVGAHFALKFREHRSAVFIFEWVKFWMRPFGFDYKVKIVKPSAREKAFKMEAMSVA